MFNNYFTRLGVGLFKIVLTFQHSSNNLKAIIKQK